MADNGQAQIGKKSAGLSYLHHESTTDSVEGIREDSGCRSDSLCHRPLGNEVGVLLVGKDDTLGGIVQPKVCASVHNDTLQANTPSAEAASMQSTKLGA